MPLVPEDQPPKDTPSERRFAMASQAVRYDAVRGWGIAYSRGQHERANYSGSRPLSRDAVLPTTVPTPWPIPTDAPTLRTFLADPDPGIRGLAIEALATLHQPEDAGRIGALLDDLAESAPALGYNQQMTALAIRLNDLSDAKNAPSDWILPLREWHTRTVQTYAREALKLMTGRRFDGRDPQPEPFDEWWKRNNLGPEALWYWQQRLTRDFNALDATARSAIPQEPGKNYGQYEARFHREIGARRAALRHAVTEELRQLPPEAEAKIYLLTHGDNTPSLTGPVNEFLDDPPRLRISRA